VIHAYLNPLVKWIWLGGAVLVFGTLIALLPDRKAVLVLSREAVRAPTPGDALVNPLQPTMASTPVLREGHD
jgi:hypothetical protein